MRKHLQWLAQVELLRYNWSVADKCHFIMAVIEEQFFIPRLVGDFRDPLQGNFRGGEKIRNAELRYEDVQIIQAIW